MVNPGLSGFSGKKKSIEKEKIQTDSCTANKPANIPKTEVARDANKIPEKKNHL